MILIIILIIVICLFIYFLLNRAKILGAWGEKKVSTLLKFLGKEYIVFNDVLIKTSFGTSQIDHLVISPYGVFVIETKNYKGWIMGGENSEKWTQNIWGNKYELTNPIRQNNGHILALKHVLSQFASNQFIPIIVFSHHATLKVQVPDKCNVIYTYELISRIHSFKNVILNTNQINTLCRELNNKILKSKEEKETHIQSVKQKEYRTSALKRSGICPRCGGNLVLRHGNYGSFFGCSNYPNCKYTCK